jgi:hypothetical protein
MMPPQLTPENETDPCDRRSNERRIEEIKGLIMEVLSYADTRA